MTLAELNAADRAQFVTALGATVCRGEKPEGERRRRRLTCAHS